MAEEAEETDDAPKKKSKLPLLIGVVLALAGGGGGFFAVQSGMIGGGGGEKTEVAEEKEGEEAKPLTVAFVALEPVVISLPSSGGRDHLRFAANLEVPPEYVAEVEALKPRLIDVMNSYLRAVELTELEDPTSLMRLRGQMLRRLQVVAGEGRISDLLIMEFVLS